MKTLTWQKPGQQNVAQELIKIIINYVAELRIIKKFTGILPIRMYDKKLCFDNLFCLFVNLFLRLMRKN